MTIGGLPLRDPSLLIESPLSPTLKLPLLPEGKPAFEFCGGGGGGLGDELEGCLGGTMRTG